jgi:hypothetical protein
MWKNVGNDKIQKMEGKRIKSEDDDNGTLDPKKRRGYWRVDCQSASKGLFLGLLCLVGGIIILIIFFVMKVRHKRDSESEITVFFPFSVNVIAHFFESHVNNGQLMS